MSLIRFTIIEPDKIELLKELYAASLELPDDNPNSLRGIISSYVLMKEGDEDVYTCLIHEIAQEDIDDEEYDDFLERLGPYITDRLIPNENSYDFVRHKISGILDFSFKTLGDEVLDIEIPSPDVYDLTIVEVLYHHILTSYKILEQYEDTNEIHLKIKKKDPIEQI